MNTYEQYAVFTETSAANKGKTREQNIWKRIGVRNHAR